MSAFIGKDSSQTNVVHFTSSVETPGSMRAGLLPTTTFHSRNPYANVKYVRNCLRSANQSNYGLSLESNVASENMCLRYDVPSDVSWYVNNGSYTILFLIPVPSSIAGGGYYTGLSSRDAAVYQYDGSQLLAVFKDSNAYNGTFPSLIKMFILENNPDNLLSNQLAGAISITKSAFTVGGINIFDYSFLRLSDSSTSYGNEMSYKIVNNANGSFYTSYSYLFVNNYQSFGDISMEIKNKTVYRNGNPVIGTFSKDFIKLTDTETFYNSTVSGDSRITLGNGTTTFNNLRSTGIVIQLGFTPTYGVMMALKLTMVAYYGTTPYYFPFVFNGILKKNTTIEVFYGGVTSSSQPLSRLYGALVGSQLMLDGFVRIDNSAIPAPYNMLTYDVLYTQTAEPQARMSGIRGTIANLNTLYDVDYVAPPTTVYVPADMGVANYWIDIEYFVPAADVAPNEATVYAALQNKYATKNYRLAYSGEYAGGTTAPTTYGYWDPLTVWGVTINPRVTINNTLCYIFYDGDEGDKYYRCFLRYNGE